MRSLSSWPEGWFHPQLHSTPPSHSLRSNDCTHSVATCSYSDTTATTLTHIIYELVRHPSHISKLRKELTSIDPSVGPHNIKHVQIQHLDHLNGVIYETLRLHPPVPTALQRLTPPEGMTIGGVFIPGNTTVWSPQYVLGRCKLPVTKDKPLPSFCV